MLLAPVRGQAAGRLSEAQLRDAAAIVFIIDPLSRRRLPMQRVRDAYGLTRAEVRVAFAVSAGISVVAAADLLGVSANTVKSHLRSVFIKTGARGQVELARLMAVLDGMPLV
jgi:DNA-binding CsgD family transcriptional regulator